MIITVTPTKEGFDAVFSNPSFKCAFITPSDQYAFGKVRLLKRHNDTDEIFVLLSGSAVLLTKDENASYQTTPLQPETAYNVVKGTWHHLALSENAVVFVTESGSMQKENTDSMNIESENIFV